MAGWKPIATAPREVGRPLLLYPRPRAVLRQQSDGPLLDLGDAAVRQTIKLAKNRGYMTHGELDQVLPAEDFTLEQIEYVLAQLSAMGIIVIRSEATEGKKGGEARQPVPTAKHEEPRINQPDPTVIYASVFEGCWDGSSWRTSTGLLCKPTHWMLMPAPPLTLVCR
jgi:Sigma-70 factor, region 1.1